MNRRRFGRIAAGALLTGVAARKAKAWTEQPWGMWIEPDIQNMVDPAYACGNAPELLQDLRGFEFTERNLPVAGLPINARGVLNFGDCMNAAIATSFRGQGQLTAQCATQLWNQKLFLAPCTGNHDALFGGSRGGRGTDAAGRTNNSNLDAVWRTVNGSSNPFSPPALAAVFGGSGLTLAPDAYGSTTDAALWGGAFTEPDGSETGANCFYLLRIQFRRILVLVLEFHARPSVWAWAQQIHDENSDCEVWILTHSFVAPVSNTGGDNPNNLIRRDSANIDPTGGNPLYDYGPTSYDNGAPDSFGPRVSTSADEAWNGDGSGVYEALKYWDRLTFIGSGHSLVATEYQNPWWWQANRVTSSSRRRQPVVQMFFNMQYLDVNSAGSSVNPSGFSVGNVVARACGANPTYPDGVSDVGHVGFIRFNPKGSNGRYVEAYGLSYNRWRGGNGPWIGNPPHAAANPTAGNPFGAPSQWSTPQQWFAYPAPGVGVSPEPSRAVSRHGP